MIDVRVVCSWQKYSYSDVLPAVPPGDMKLYRSSFLRDFWHLNVAMMTSNNALVPDPDKEDILASSPTDWPFMRLGLRMCGWGDNQAKYYLLGTPLIWWSGSASVILSLLLLGLYLFRQQRKFVDMDAREWIRFQCLCASFNEGDRGLGSLFVRGQDCILWLVLALRCVARRLWFARI